MSRMVNWSKVITHLPRAPWILGAAARQFMFNLTYRRLADIGKDSIVLNEGIIINPSGSRDRVKIGKGCRIRGELMVQTPGGKIVMGDNCFLGAQSYIWAWDEAGLKIGDRVLISHHVNIQDTDSHSFNPLLRAMHFQAIASTGHPRFVPDVKTRPIAIHDDAWIGYGASIAKGVTIGEGAVVAFRSVVLQDVEPWTVVAGFPAKPVREVADADAIREALRTAFSSDIDPVAAHIRAAARGDRDLKVPPPEPKNT